MRPDRINYQKTFNLGNYTSERIGLEAELEAGDDVMECYQKLKDTCEEFHQKNKSEVAVNVFEEGKSYPSGEKITIPPPPSIDRKAIDQLEIDIDNATSIEELSTYKDEAARLSLVSNYMNKLKELS